MSTPFRVFVTATDTGVGKTETSCALLSLLADRGQAPGAFKPYESGCVDLEAPADAVALKAAARCADPLENICPHRFALPLAPGVAAARLGRTPDFSRTLSAFGAFERRPLVVEGAGGLLVPIDDRRLVVDLIAELKLPVLLVARAGLGTLNHTGLSVEALRRRGIPLLAVLLSSASGGEDVSEVDNADWLTRLYGVRVLGPIAHLREPASRREAFRGALSPLLDESPQQ